MYHIIFASLLQTLDLLFLSESCKSSRNKFFTFQEINVKKFHFSLNLNKIFYINIVNLRPYIPLSMSRFSSLSLNLTLFTSTEKWQFVMLFLQLSQHNTITKQAPDPLNFSATALLCIHTWTHNGSMETKIKVLSSSQSRNQCK